MRKEIESAYDIKGYSYELTNNEVIETLGYFKNIIDIYPKIIQEIEIKLQNGLYYPYYIAKILSLVIQDTDRLNTLLSNIHFQSKTILNRNEYIWKEICKHLQYEYSPLD